MKRQEQHNTIGYLFMLRRLAHICFKDKKYKESEKYFKIVAKLMPEVSNQSPIQIFNAKENLVNLYIHTNLEKAQEVAN